MERQNTRRTYDVVLVEAPLGSLGLRRQVMVTTHGEVPRDVTRVEATLATAVPTYSGARVIREQQARARGVV